MSNAHTASNFQDRGREYNRRNGKRIANRFLAGALAVLLCKKMQSGKTEDYINFMYLLMLDDIETVFVVMVAKPDISLTEQTVERIHGAFGDKEDRGYSVEEKKEALRHDGIIIETSKAKLLHKSNIRLVRRAKRVVFIFDETHTYDTDNNLGEIVRAYKEECNNVAILYITATPGVDGIDGARVKKENRIFIEADKGYYGVDNYLEDGYLHQIEDSKGGIYKADKKTLKTQVQAILDRVSSPEDIVMLRNQGEVNIALLMEQYPNIKFIECNSTKNKFTSAWKGLEDLKEGTVPTDRAVCYIFKQGLKAGATLSINTKKRIVGIYETIENNDAGTLQAFIGRMVGYGVKPNPRLEAYVSIDAIERYIGFWEGTLTHLSTTGTPKAGADGRKETIVRTTYSISDKEAFETPGIETSEMYETVNFTNVRLPKCFNEQVKGNDKGFSLGGRRITGKGLHGKDKNTFILKFDSKQGKREGMKENQERLRNKLEAAGIDTKSEDGVWYLKEETRCEIADIDYIKAIKSDRFISKN